MEQQAEAIRRENSEDRLDARLVPLLVTPAQYYGGYVGRKSSGDSVQRLMLAVLVDAIHWFQSDSGRLPFHRKQICIEAREWLFQKGGTGPFCFETVCEAIDIEPSLLRRSLVRWKATSGSRRWSINSRRAFIAAARISAPGRRGRKHQPGSRITSPNSGSLNVSVIEDCAEV